MAQTLLPPTKVSKRAVRTVKMASATAHRSKNLSITTGGKISAQSVENLSIISSKLINVDNFLKDSLVLDKVKAGISQKKAEQDLRKKEEDESEKDTPGKLKLPGQKFFGKVNNWITKLIFGWLAIKLIDLLPALMKWLPKIGAAIDWIIKWSGKILNGLVTFIDKGYEAVEKTQEWIKEKWGEGAEEKFTNLIGGLNKVMNATFILGMTTAAFADALGGIDIMGLIEKLKKVIKNLQEKIPKITESISQGARKLSVWAQRKVGPKGRKFIKNIGPSVSKQITNVVTAVKDTKIARQATEVIQNQQKRIAGAIEGGRKGITDFASGVSKKWSSGIDWLKKGTISNWNKLNEGRKAIGKRINSTLSGWGANLRKMGAAAKQIFIEKILTPVKEFLDPLMKRVAGMGDTITKQLMKIPGFEWVMKLLKKKGAKSIFDVGPIMKAIGPKAIDIIGGVINLLFSYDRFASGDSIGGLIEGVSGLLDLSGLPPPIGPGFLLGPKLSLGLDAYMFARDLLPDFFPEADLKAGEDELVKNLGLGGMKNKLDNLLGKLPNLGEIAGMFGGGKGKESAEDTPTSGSTQKSGLDSTSSEGSDVISGESSNKGSGNLVVSKDNSGLSEKVHSVSSSASYDDGEPEVVFVELPAKVIPVSGGSEESSLLASSSGGNSGDYEELYIR